MTALATNQFNKISELAYDRWGLDLTEKKRELVSNRLAKFLRRSPYDTVDEYLRHLENEADEEDMLMFFDLLSTNVTSFFRERAHFDYLEREFYTPLARGNMTTPGRKIRVWSAACSKGPEPYSLVMHAMEHLPDFDSWDFRVLGTDLSNSAVADAKAAVYPDKMVADLPKELVKKHFLRGTGDKSGIVKVAKHITDKVTIKRLNLMEKWPVKGPFDIIFCRNVMIYFDRPTRQRLTERLADLLRPGGILAVGSAESLSSLDTPLTTVQPSVYMK